MRLILAPMQGVLDPLLRELLTEVNDYDLCVSEFIRVVDQRLPPKVFYRHCPELLTISTSKYAQTASGTPVRVQLLGQSPHWLAENANRAIELGSSGIDFNCGCPSKTVNGSGGGATLLKDPETIYLAVKAIREAVGDAVPFSVKIRLGWDSANGKFEIADAVQQGGASELAVHGRTKLDGYRADSIDWNAIGMIRRRLSIPVIANGEIRNWETAQHCIKTTGCESLMVARGALTIPNLSYLIKENRAALPWENVVSLLKKYLTLENPYDHGLYHVGRIKQWFAYLKPYYHEEAEQLFQQIKETKNAQILAQLIDSYASEIEGSQINSQKRGESDLGVTAT